MMKKFFPLDSCRWHSPPFFVYVANLMVLYHEARFQGKPLTWDILDRGKARISRRRPSPL